MSIPDDSTSKALSVEPVQMVAIDLDGTLLRTDNRIGPATVTAIKQAGERGIQIILASARPPRTTIKFYKQLGLKNLQINHNGALIFDPQNQNIFHHQALKYDLAAQVLHLIKKTAPNLKIGVEVVDALYTNRPGDYPDSSRVNGIRSPGSLDDIQNQSVTKIFMTGKTTILSELQATLTGHLAGQIEFAISHLRLLQVVAAGVDKAPALARVAKHYGISQQGVAAIGDAPNDLGMMHWAGLAIAVNNAWQDVRKAANFVVPSNDEDGVAQALAKYVLS